MYQLLLKPSEKLTYLEYDKNIKGYVFLVGGIIYEIFSLILMYYIFINFPQSETEFFLSFVLIQQLPFYTILSSIGVFFLLYAIKVFFYVEGWEMYNDQDTSLGIKFFSKLGFLKSQLNINLADIQNFVIHEIFFDEYRLNKRQRLEIKFHNQTSNNVEQKVLFYDKYGDLDYEIPRIIKFSQQIFNKELKVEKSSSS